MRDNKEFGFDILEKSNMTTIEEIGTDKMSVDKKEMDRILKNTMKKYEKKKQDETYNNTVENDEGSDLVSGVEVHEHRNISHILYIVLCSAAALVLTIGSLVMLKHNKDISPNPPDPVIESATNTTEATSLSSTKTTLTSTVTSTGKVTGTQTETTTYTTSASDSTTTTAPISSEQNHDNDNGSETLIYNNPHTERTDITQEELDKARNNLLSQMIDDEYPIWHIRYAYLDINNDNIPELFTSHNYIGEGYTHMWIYDGEKYIRPSYKSRSEKMGMNEFSVCGAMINVCPEENLIFISTLLGWNDAVIIKIDKDNNLETICEYYGPGYYNGEKIENRDPDNQDPEGLVEFNSILTAHKWQKLEFTEYAAKNNAAIKFEEETGREIG